MMADDVLPVMRIEILPPQLTIGHFVTQDKVDGIQNTVRNHDCSLLFAFATGKSAKCGPELRRFGVARGVSTFDEDRSEPFVAFAGPPTLTLASTPITSVAILATLILTSSSTFWRRGTSVLWVLTNWRRYRVRS
jgi:hypothetical protein